MLAQKNSCRRHAPHPSEAAKHGYELVLAEDDERFGGSAVEKSCRESSSAVIEHPSKFIKGIIIALPASITLWAGMILGFRAIF